MFHITCKLLPGVSPIGTLSHNLHRHVAQLSPHVDRLPTCSKTLQLVGQSQDTVIHRWGVLSQATCAHQEMKDTMLFSVLTELWVLRNDKVHFPEGFCWIFE